MPHYKHDPEVVRYQAWWRAGRADAAACRAQRVSVAADRPGCTELEMGSQGSPMVEEWKCSSLIYFGGPVMETLAWIRRSPRWRMLRLGCLTVTLLAGCAAPMATSDSVAWKKEKLSTGDDPHLPLTIGGSRCDSTLVGTYRLCLARDGGVQSVEVVAGIPEADESIVATLRGWRYRPLPLPLCFQQNLAFRVECRGSGRPATAGAGTSGTQPELASVASPGPGLPTVDVQESWFAEHKISQGDDPRAPPELQQLSCGEQLRGRYRLCINQTGTVQSVTPLHVAFDASGQIAAALKSWRFRPQPTAVCVEKQIEFVAAC